MRGGTESKLSREGLLLRRDCDLHVRHEHVVRGRARRCSSKAFTDCAFKTNSTQCSESASMKAGHKVTRCNQAYVSVKKADFRLAIWEMSCTCETNKVGQTLLYQLGRNTGHSPV